MENGDSINYPGRRFDHGCPLTNWSHQGYVTLPWPERDSQYLFFHQNEDDSFWPTSLLLTTIDMRANGGLGRVVTKNELIAQGPFAHMISAVRHGNGRDWWVVSPMLGNDQFMLFLLDPDGLQGPFIKKSPSTWTGSGTIFWAHQCAFSPQGNRFARANGENGLHVYNFDRCTGEFSCPRTTQFPGEPGGGFNGVAFSPSGRYLYASNGGRELWQFDLAQSDLGQSAILIDTFDGFKAPLHATFYQLMHAPNGKIYMSCTNGAYVLHTIHRPDEKGLACEFGQHDLELPAQNGAVLPNFPYFRLYDWADSPCDTLGIDAPEARRKVLFSEGLKVFPNPAKNTVKVLTPGNCDAGTALKVFTVTGILVLEAAWLTPGEPFNLDVSGLADGAYFLTVEGACGKRIAKLVVAK